MIAVYDDEGVVKAPLNTLLFELSAWQTKTISAKEILETPWEADTKLLIIPGGRDIPYHNALKGVGNKRIRDFVESGGSFLGICAGAYFGCSLVEFDKGGELEVTGTRELAFFPGTAIGPAYGTGTYFYDSEKGMKASLISKKCGNTFRAYFNGGCYFANAERYHEIEIISRYLEIPGNPAAIIQTPQGMGKVILTGVHFEIGLTDPNTTLIGKLKKPFLEHEATRRHFFEEIINSLLLGN